MKRLRHDADADCANPFAMRHLRAFLRRHGWWIAAAVVVCVAVRHQLTANRRMDDAELNRAIVFSPDFDPTGPLRYPVWFQPAIDPEGDMIPIGLLPGRHLASSPYSGCIWDRRTQRTSVGIESLPGADRRSAFVWSNLRREVIVARCVAARPNWLEADPDGDHELVVDAVSPDRRAIRRVARIPSETWWPRMHCSANGRFLVLAESMDFTWNTLGIGSGSFVNTELVYEMNRVPVLMDLSTGRAATLPIRASAAFACDDGSVVLLRDESILQAWPFDPARQSEVVLRSEGIDRDGTGEYVSGILAWAIPWRPNEIVFWRCTAERYAPQRTSPWVLDLSTLSARKMPHDSSTSIPAGMSCLSPGRYHPDKGWAVFSRDTDTPSPAWEIAVLRADGPPAPSLDKLNAIPPPPLFRRQSDITDRPVFVSESDLAYPTSAGWRIVSLDDLATSRTQMDVAP